MRDRKAAATSPGERNLTPGNVRVTLKCSSGSWTSNKTFLTHARGRENPPRPDPKSLASGRPAYARSTTFADHWGQKLTLALGGALYGNMIPVPRQLIWYAVQLPPSERQSDRLRRVRAVETG